MGYRADCSKAVFAVISEAEPENRKSGIIHRSTSSEVAVGDPGDSGPDWRKVGVRERRSGRRQVIRMYPRKEEFRAYPVYHIDDGLGIVPAEITDRLELILTREDRPN